MRALVKFTDDLEALVEDIVDVRWMSIDDSNVIIRFFGENDCPISDFTYHSVRSVDYDYDE